LGGFSGKVRKAALSFPGAGRGWRLTNGQSSMGVTLLPIIHKTGSHCEVQYLVLTLPNHGQTLGDEEEVVGQLPTRRQSRDLISHVPKVREDSS
jgi:hypothetical protein